MNTTALRFGLSFLLLVLFPALLKAGNVAYVVKVEEGSGYGIYEVIETWDIPGASEEPTLSDDISAYTNPPVGGPWCDDDGVCFDPRSSNGFSQAPQTLDDDRYVGERMVVVGFLLPFGGTVFPRLSLQGGGGGGSTPGEPDLRVRPDPANESCTSDNSTLNAAKSDLSTLFEDSNFSEFKNVRESNSYGGVEQAGFLLPNGTFIDLGAIGALNNQTACGFEFNGSAMDNLSIPSGTMFIHSHPWSDGDDQIPACGPPPGGTRRIYQSRPGSEDANALEILQDFYDTEIIGVVIDGDSIIFYDEDENETDRTPRCY